MLFSFARTLPNSRTRCHISYFCCTSVYSRTGTRGLINGDGWCGWCFLFQLATTPGFEVPNILKGNSSSVIWARLGLAMKWPLLYLNSKRLQSQSGQCFAGNFAWTTLATYANIRPFTLRNKQAKQTLPASTLMYKQQLCELQLKTKYFKQHSLFALNWRMFTSGQLLSSCCILLDANQNKW